jgi:hypothetical protein
MIDDQSDPGSYADALAHSPCLRVEDYEPEGVADVAARRPCLEVKA